MASLITIMGPDNVGKTTLVEALVDYFKERINKDTKTIHFGPPSPTDPTRVAHYTLPLVRLGVKRGDIVIADRGGPEFAFYDAVRRGIPFESNFDEHNYIWVSIYKTIFEKMTFFVICPQWNEVREAHLREIMDVVPNIGEFSKKILMEKAYMEHTLYSELLNKAECFPEKRYFKITANNLQDRVDEVLSIIQPPV